VPEYKDVLLDELRSRGEAIGKAVTGQTEALGLALTLFAAHYMGVLEGIMAMTGYEFFRTFWLKPVCFPVCWKASD
jgi:hypothetical protein